MVLLRSGKKTRNDAPKVTADNNDRPVLDLNAAVSDEEKRAPRTAPKPRTIQKTPKSTGRKSTQRIDEKPKAEEPKGEKPRRTPRKTASTTTNESRRPVSARKKKVTEAVGNKAGSCSRGSGASKSPFLKSGAGEARRKRLSEEKHRARKLSEGKGTDSKRITIKVQSAQKHAHTNELRENLARGIDSVIVGPSIQISLYHLLNSKPVVGASDLHKAKDEMAVLSSRKNNNERLRMEFHQIDWSDDENEEWSDSGSERSGDGDDKSIDLCEVEYRSSLSSTGSVSYQHEDVPAAQVNREEESVDPGSPSSRVAVWWEPDDEVEGGVEVIDGTSAAHTYSRETDDSSGVSPSSISSSASMSSWHTANGSVSLSAAFHSTNRRYAEGQDDRKLRGW